MKVKLLHTSTVMQASFKYQTITNVNKVTILRNYKTGYHPRAVTSGLQVSYGIFHSYKNSFPNDEK